MNKHLNNNLLLPMNLINEIELIEANQIRLIETNRKFIKKKAVVGANLNLN